jgi:alanine racemase
MSVPARTARPRIIDVAERAGVSKTAVSFAFNSPNRLSPETVARIMAIADELGYRPNPVARLLTQRRTMSIGVMTPQPLAAIFANPFYGALFEGVGRVAEESGYALHFIAPDRGSLAMAMDRSIVDGLVIVGLPADHHELDRLRDARIPMVLVDSTAMTGAPAIRVDDEGGAYKAAAHILDLGHRDLLILAIAPTAPYPPTDEHGVGPDRLRGYVRAFADRGIPFPVDRLIGSPSTFDGGAETVRAAWASALRPTAIIAMSDAIAIGAMAAIRGLGLRIPDDLSIIGFDDLDVAEHIHPPLTTIHQPSRVKGEMAMRWLLELLDHHDGDHEQAEPLETTLLVRGSTGPVPVR